MQRTSNDEFIIERAVHLSLIEVCLGSFLHALAVPFGGHFLSLNQGLFLSTVANDSRQKLKTAKSIIEISLVVAIMKSLAPIGKKFGPMMSISMQGFLYSLGIFFLGTGKLGQILGMILLSLWAFVQPFITWMIIYGADLFGAFKYFLSKFESFAGHPSYLYITIASIVIIKVFIAGSIPIILSLLPGHFLSRYESYLSKFIRFKPKKKVKSPTKGAFSDLLRPSVMISFILMGLFFYFHKKDGAYVLWKTLRAISIAFILFYVLRSPLVALYALKCANKSRWFNRLYNISTGCLARISEYNDPIRPEKRN